ncbi:MAG: hypothetical protein N2C14_11970 [Planctomycetales bacterium]
MHIPTLNRQVFTDPSWLHWAITIPLLAASLAGQTWAIPAAMVLCAGVGIGFLARLRQLRPYPVQVRIVYLGLLALGTVPGMFWVHWVQLAGTTLVVTTGYCPLIRMLSLAPFNRDEPLTASLAWRTFVTQRSVGGLLVWASESSSESQSELSAAACCSLDSAACCSLDSASASPMRSTANLQPEIEDCSHAPIH